MSSGLSLRETNVVDLPLAKDAFLLHPELTIVRFDGRKAIDLGSLCYLDRDFRVDQYRGQQSPNRSVRLNSLSEPRKTQIRKLIAQVSDELRYSGRRPETIRDRYSRFVPFMSWADQNGWQSILFDKEQVRPALRSYINYLRERVRASEITNNSAAHQQNRVIQVLELYHDEESFDRGLNLLYVIPGNRTSTSPPAEDKQGRVLSLSKAFFDGVCQLVLVPSPFPHAVSLPAYLGWTNNTLWLFPSNERFLSPEKEAQGGRALNAARCYNYRQGRLNTIQEVRDISIKHEFAGHTDLEIRRVLNNARRSIEKANVSNRIDSRLTLGYHAMAVFCILFISETGMNWAQVAQLTWSDDFEVLPSRQAFRTVKWRADGKVVSFELPVAFMPVFKQYLALRKYLLDGCAGELLFFKRGMNKQGAPTPLKDYLLSTIYLLQRIDPQFPKITTREWRAAKSDWLVRNTDPSTAALVLQNTERTVLQSYAEGSESVQLAEMSSFLEQVSSRVLSPSESLINGVSRATGSCASFGEPAPLMQASPQLDCKRPEGCLFCDKHRVHADEKDMRKILSCQYVLRQMAGLSSGNEQAHAMLTRTFEQIEAILSDMNKYDEKMLKRVRKEVFDDGELAPYWAEKYEMFLSLGVIA